MPTFTSKKKPEEGPGQLRHQRRLRDKPAGNREAKPLETIAIVPPRKRGRDFYPLMKQQCINFTIIGGNNIPSERSVLSQRRQQGTYRKPWSRARRKRKSAARQRAKGVPRATAPKDRGTTPTFRPSTTSPLPSSCPGPSRPFRRRAWDEAPLGGVDGAQGGHQEGHPGGRHLHAPTPPEKDGAVFWMYPHLSGWTNRPQKEA